MKTPNSDHNQGEGDKLSARHYNRHARQFVAEGKVEPAAREAKDFVERDPQAAADAEERAKRGPRHSRTRTTVDQLIARGRTVFDRIAPLLSRATAMVRRRLHLSPHRK